MVKTACGMTILHLQCPHLQLSTFAMTTFAIKHLKLSTFAMTRLPYTLAFISGSAHGLIEVILVAIKSCLSISSRTKIFDRDQHIELTLNVPRYLNLAEFNHFKSLFFNKESGVSSHNTSRAMAYGDADCSLSCFISPRAS